MVHPGVCSGDEELLDLVDALSEMVLKAKEGVAIRGHLGDYNEAGSFVSTPTRQETVCPSNLFHFLDSISSVFVDWQLISDLKVR